MSPSSTSRYPGPGRLAGRSVRRYLHGGGLKLFAGRVPVHVRRTELSYGMSGGPAPEQHGIFRVDYDDPRIDWRHADGDAEIAPGVTVVLTAGHTPGHQGFVVNLDAPVGGGGIVFAFDAADRTQNIDDELAVGGFIDVEPEESVVQIRKLKRLAASGATGWSPVTTRSPGRPSPAS